MTLVEPPQSLGTSFLSLTRLKWLTIVAPISFLVVVSYLLRGPFHELFHEFPGYLYVLAVLTVAVSAFSFLVFGVISRLEQRVLEQNRELAGLLAVGQAVTSPVPLAELLDDALDVVLAVTPAEAAELWLVTGRQELTLERHRGIGREAAAPGTRVRFGEGLPGVAARDGATLMTRELGADSRCVRPELVEFGFRIFCAAPLRQKEETLGVLAVAARDPHSFAAPAQSRLLEGIGKQLAVAIDNARLQDRVLDAAVLEERERLARELHDSLAQVLGYVNTQALAIRKLLASGRGDEAKRQVVEMEASAKRVYTDVREAILGLRASQRGLVTSLDGYLSDFRRVTGCSAELEVSEEVAELSLPGSVEIQLIRIVQEALTNVRKHADSSAAVVRLTVVEQELRVEVEDDGRGFDLGHDPRTGWPHFGLQTMRERAQAIGGSFAVVSKPGAGARVLVSLPVQASWEARHASSAG